jgi:NitT/TauT family transport system substrate-binding protein
MMIRNAFASVLFAICLVLPARAMTERSPAAQRVVLAVDGINDTRNLPALLAERLGYFRAEGLTVTLVDAPADPSPADLMADGRADGAVAYYHHTFMSQAIDHTVTQAVVVMGVTPGLRVMVAERLRATVKAVSDLKGLKIYTGGSNSGKTTTANWLMLHAGYDIQDYTAVPLLPRDEMVRALKDGRADAIVAHEPDAGYYLASGIAFELADVATVEGTRKNLGSVFPSTSLYLPRSYIDAHPQIVQQLVNAFLKAITYIQGHDARGIAAVLSPKAGGKDRDALFSLIAKDKAMFATDGLMPADAARGEWRAMTALKAKYAAIKLAETFTNKFVEQAHAGQPPR